MTAELPSAAPLTPRRARSERGRSIRLVALGVILVFVIAGAFYFVTRKPTRTVTAHFDEAVGVYVGSDVRILGVRVGQITKITPHVDNIEVEMTYDASYKVPANAIAVVVPPSIVSDRYLQLAPVYTGGAQLPNDADIPKSRTASPVELDDIYKSLSDLSVALGPSGDGKSSPLNDLIETTEKNLDGNGALLGQTFTDLSKAAKTFADSSGDLFGTVKNLQAFTTALANSDSQVRHLNEQLATVASSLADERGSLALALKNLSGALTDISSFISKNQMSIHTSVSSLKDVTATLVQQKAALNEFLQVVPTAVSNITHAFNPVTGVFDAQGVTMDHDDTTGGLKPTLITKVPAHADGSSSGFVDVPGAHGVSSWIDQATGDLVKAGS
ncbi:phospholipid/cholesterol/gamma-HCH transport system substrate-binding protein [Jatrophihabitans sp. GAS493]|uniref:MCE family protein n=1 Tax=Jatrophihabitans sp. GAS493 TaxID=1907575 RepID=UPI000BB7A7D3|nr:MCE family protein [Jatrophihabitans sp. GAS493]SOD72376.1 phospholipid/cholesterol/gamma-HCH transport system substrate-binding protein [Jatrophihabitans sp. GAS493]